MASKKLSLDLPQAVVLAVVLGSAIIAAGLVLTFGPEDSRTQVAGWIAGVAGNIGVVIAVLRARGLFSSAPEEDAKGRSESGQK